LHFMTTDKAVQSGEHSAPSSTRAIYSESGYGHLSFGWSMLRVWRTGKYLYVDAPERELYDQTADPEARHNLAPDSKAVADTAAAQMAEFRRKTVAQSKEKTQLTAEQTENLHALGYMGSDATALNDTNGEAGPDPKQKIAIVNLLYEAMVHTEEARYQEAVPILEEVVKQEPHALTAYLLLGPAYVSLKQYQKAIPLLQHVVETTPDNSLAHYELGCALMKTGRWNDAASFVPRRIALLTSSMAAVKQGRWSPIFTPLSQTAAPNCALLMRRMATLFVSEISNVRRSRTSCGLAATRRRCRRGRSSEASPDRPLF
jgi:tetratricopeptide (TPR) repeat protein